MPLQQPNISDFSARRNSATVHSLARPQTPPDTLPLTASLQTTLELEEILAIFFSEAKNHVELDGLHFRGHGGGITIQHGEAARHRSSYALTIQHEELGDIGFSRNRPFGENELARLEYLLCALVYPLRNALRYLSALSAAYRDPLTGAANRAALEEAMEREVELAQRHGRDLSLLVMDLDHFKRINDQYGHSAGDCVLREAVRRAQDALRGSDQLFRFGGEEFVVVLNSTSLEGACQVAERIRASLEQLPCSCDEGEVAVTASIGVAALEAEDNQHTLFDKADKAVYRAKALGRNRVMVYEP